MTNTQSNDRQQTPRSDLARVLLALANPIRLRMLNLMFEGPRSPQQFAHLLGVDEKTISKHLVLFRESKIVAWHTKRNIKYYTARQSADSPHFRLLLLVIELLKDDAAFCADVAILNRSQEAAFESWLDEITHSPNGADRRNSLAIVS